MAAVHTTVTYLGSYFRFLLDHKRLVTFGLLTSTLSGFGQTFFIGLFNPNLREVFGLGHGQIGLIYGAATLTSAVLFTYVGRLYDRTELWVFLSGSAVVLAAGCALMAGAEGLALLFLALLLLRHGGQGLMGHISLTTMARYFYQGRGKALSVAALGFTLAEATFPPAAVAVLDRTDWRVVWWVGAAVVLGVFLPVLLWLLRDEGERGEAPSETDRAPDRDWTLWQALTDKRFALVLPAAVTAPFVVTVMFFHLAALAADKGWTLELAALGISMFAVGHVIGVLGGGPLVDRFTGAGTITPALIPMALSFAVLAAFEATWAALVWPLLLGLSMGVGQTAISDLLAEMYGPSHLGAIRAIVHALVVVSTALGPPLIGLLLDQGVGSRAIAFGFALSVALAAGLAWAAVGRGPVDLSPLEQ